MKNVFLIFLSLLAGFTGSYIFNKLNREKHTESVIYENHAVSDGRFVNYSGVNLSEEANFVAASAASTPSVVYIKTATAQQVAYDWFDLFFYGQPQTQVVVSSGSGIIYSTDGYIITNNHVISKADQIEVIHNKRSYKAKLIGTDPSTDLAILKIETENLPAFKIGSSKKLAVGDWVLAVGNPFNLESTVTAGIVSAKGRNIGILKDRFPIESFIQTDAAINPGNSGGALVNLKGELIGINTAILSQTGQYAGYGFAVPIDIARKVADDIIKYGEVQKTFFGADVAEVDAETAKKSGLNEITGVVITKILQDGAAEKVGMKKGDIILEINDDKIESKSSFDEELSYYRPGDKVRVKFKRDEKIIEGSLTLTNIDGTTEILKKELYFSELLGANLETVPKVERARLGLENGVRIGKITQRGLISRMGIGEGFIVLAVNKKPISKPQELAAMLEKISGRVIIEGITAEGQRGYYSFIF